MKPEATRFLARQAWVNGAWANHVLLGVDAHGNWDRIQADAMPQQALGATPIDEPVLPGLVNAHSHAFQRAIAGLTERRSTTAGASDDFWSWRERMYSAANRITPAQLETIAAQLYSELLAGGYTQVCEFHYLHHDKHGQPYPNPAEMSLALVRAAQRTGIGLTLLPTLYMRSGFTVSGLRDEQRRFAGTPDSIARIVEQVQRQLASDACIKVGVAVHSLRAVGPAALQQLAAYAQQAELPLHIHIAEQAQEVQDCLAHTGQRPLEWLLRHTKVDTSWNLVHATHATAAELTGVRNAGASIVICPTTEANLGDGVFDLPAYAAVNGHWSIGSDSHVARSWPQELRLLEYSQRLTLRRRNIAAQCFGHSSSAGALLQGALAGGASASGLALGGLKAGQRADFVTLDVQSAALLGIAPQHLLDALVFSGPASAFKSIYVAGQRTQACAQLPQDYCQTMRELWGEQ